jgi:predicted transposase/invertase (TIGR01784 family)
VAIAPLDIRFWVVDDHNHQFSTQLIELASRDRLKQSFIKLQIYSESNADCRAYNLAISMYDDTCRFLAEHFSADFASWLLGKPVTLTEIQPSELSLDPIRADALIFLESDESILHLEFQTLPKDNIPFRVLDYRVRGYRRNPAKSMRQVVIYLKQTGSELVYQTSFTMERTHHEFEVVRLWEQPASLFLQYLGLIPFAVLGQSADPEETLRQAAQRVAQIADPTTQANLMAASGILAGLVCAIRC